jgi:PBP1b-binding outer membrane lipoprotein LpoB
MKRLHRLIIIITAYVLTASCSELVKDMNVDPNNTTQAPTDLILTGAQVAAVNFNGSRIAT